MNTHAPYQHYVTSFFNIELLLQHVTVKETEAFGIPPNKGNMGQYFVYTLPFYKQTVVAL